MFTFLPRFKKYIASCMVALSFFFIFPQITFAQYIDPIQNIKELGLDTIGYIIINQVIKKLSAQTVNWINSGFKGSPAFVENPKNFFLDAADKTVANVLSNTSLNQLCSPFKAQVRLALVKNYLSETDPSTSGSCTLGKIADNFDNFTQDFDQGGWDTWFQVTQNNSNNPYGAYLDAKNQMYLQIGNQQNSVKEELNWGSGMMSWKTCPKNKQVTAADVAALSKSGTNTTIKVGDCRDASDMTTATPGSTIESQLNSVLGSGTNRLEVGDELNEVVGALLNQLVGAVVGGIGKGLAGMSKKTTSSSGTSFIDQLLNDPVAESPFPNGAPMPAGAMATCKTKGDTMTCTSDGSDPSTAQTNQYATDPTGGYDELMPEQSITGKDVLPVTDVIPGWGGDLAYNSVNNNWMVTSRDISVSPSMVVGRIISNENTPITEKFNVSPDGVIAGNPRVAFAPDVNKYLVIWATDYDANPSAKVFGRFVSATGKMLSEPFIINKNGQANISSRVEYDNVKNKFVVVIDATDTDSGTVLYTINLNGTVDEPIKLTVNSGHRFASNLAINPSSGEYCVIYNNQRDNVVDPGNTYTVVVGDSWSGSIYDWGKLFNYNFAGIKAVNPDLNLSESAPLIPGTVLKKYKNEFGRVFSRKVDVNTRTVGTEYVLSQHTNNWHAGLGSIAYNPDENNYLVISTRPSTPMRAVGRFLDSNCAPTTNEISLGEKFAVNSISYNPEAKLFGIVGAVTVQANNSTKNGEENYYILVDSSGTKISGGRIFTDFGQTGNIGPMIRANTTDGTFAAMSSRDYGLTRIITGIKLQTSPSTPEYSFVRNAPLLPDEIADTSGSNTNNVDTTVGSMQVFGSGSGVNSGNGTNGSGTSGSGTGTDLTYSGDNNANSTSGDGVFMNGSEDGQGVANMSGAGGATTTKKTSSMTTAGVIASIAGILLLIGLIVIGVIYYVRKRRGE